jgi:soluble lytic murein transglycosylase
MPSFDYEIKNWLPSLKHCKRIDWSMKRKSAFTAALSLILVLIISAPVPSFAQTDDEKGAFLAGAVRSARAGDWDFANRFVEHVNDPVAENIITWMRLRDGRGDFTEYLEFLDVNSDWPGLRLLRTKGEGKIPRNHNPQGVIAFFDAQLPRSGLGSLRLIEAYQSAGHTNLANKEALRAWGTLTMTRDEQAVFLKRFRKVLAPAHVNRVDMLLWRGKASQAERLLPNVGDDYVALARARIALRRKAAGVNTLIDAVPEALQNDAGLAFERFLWRVGKRRAADAEELLITRSTSLASLGRPEKWSERRRAYARQAMRDGENARAYKLASKHFLTSGSAYADLEWLSGYLCLRKLDRPEQALVHFQNFRAAVVTPISLGRAGYWMGRAHEAMGDESKAIEAYAFGAEYQTSFYGQLAAERANLPVDATLTGRYQTPSWNDAAFVTSSVLHAALILHHADEQDMSERFFVHLSEEMTATQQQQLGDMALDLNRPHIALMISKQAAKSGRSLPRTYYPITDLAELEIAVPASLALSIARRESEFDTIVTSHAGAQGLMQIMPRTAKKVASDLNYDYSFPRLTEDWKYNARLGSAYLAGLLKNYKGSYVLSFGAYNAGPGRIREWIKRYGDPRRDDVDVVDWIEHVPFRETRNYIMRVTESVLVYETRLSGELPTSVQVAYSVDDG